MRCAEFLPGRFLFLLQMILQKTNETKRNLKEVYYDTIKRIGHNEADLFLKWILNRTSIKVIFEVTENTIKNAGYFKSKYKISLGDSFVLATAKSYGARVISSDHHEFDIIEKSEDIRFLWIK